MIRFLTDNMVPDDVGNWLHWRGHDVIRVREVMPANSPDKLVADAAVRDGRVLVTWDKDFNDQRFKSARFAALHRLAFTCDYPTAVTRLTVLIERIEAEYAVAKDAAPLLMKIGRESVMIRC